MRITFAVTLCCLSVVSFARADDTKQTAADNKQTPLNSKQTPIDLQTQTNQKLKDDFGTAGTELKGNNLATLQIGEQTLEGVRFKVGEGMIQLAGATTPEKPKKIEGIPVGAKCTKLYILQATQWSTEDDTTVGHYTVNYEDQSHQTIPIVYAKNTFDWWKDIPPAAKSLKVAWKGTNDQTKKQGIMIHLFLATWTNPQPAKKIVSIDFESASDTPCAPFCVAITVEE